MTKTPHARMEGAEIRAMIPEAMAAMGSFNATVAKSGLPDVLLELVKIRASQLNGCAYCLQMHNNDARKMQMPQAKLDQLAAWPESPAYDARERAALEWTEAVTLIAQGGVSDEVYARVSAVFTKPELANLTVAGSIVDGLTLNLITAQWLMRGRYSTTPKSPQDSSKKDHEPKANQGSERSVLQGRDSRHEARCQGSPPHGQDPRYQGVGDGGRKGGGA